jgi:hypothetical protein
MNTNTELKLDLTNETLRNQVDEILNQFGLNFNIEKVELADIKQNRLSKFFGLYHSETNECLATVRKDYRVTQTEEIVGIILTAIKLFGNLRVVKAGSINGGRKIFIQLEIDGISIVNGERITRYLTIIDSNDKSHCLSIGIGDLTASCMNMFNYFYKKADFKLCHASTLEAKLKAIPSKISAAIEQSAIQIGTYQKMSETDVTSDDIHKLVKLVLGYDKVFTSVEDLAKKSKKSIEKMESLYDCISSEMNQKGFSVYGLFNGVTYFTTHILKSKLKRDNSRNETLLVGTAHVMNQKAFDYCVALIG